jgi:putative restriction endonuclease
MKFSSKDFEEAFLKSDMSEYQKLMLKYNYDSKGHTITATQMAEKMGYNHLGAANIHYGKLASKIGNILKIDELPKEKIGIFVDFVKTENEWKWILKKEVCLALENLKWVEMQDFYLPEEENESFFAEGFCKSIKVNAYERNPKARKACIDYHGCNCYICSVDLETIYGEIAKDYIHVHHIFEISRVGKEYEVNPITDLIPVCPNCHAMLHRKKPAYKPNELKECIKQNKLKP